MKQAFMAMIFVALASACGTTNSDTPSSGNQPAEQPAAPAHDTPAAQPAAGGGGGGGGGGGSVCSRARDCCNAYVAAMPAGGGVTAATACAGVDSAISAGGPAADASCTAMISGWRQSLQAMNHDVPAACAQ